MDGLAFVGRGHAAQPVLRTWQTAVSSRSPAQDLKRRSETSATPGSLGTARTTGQQTEAGLVACSITALIGCAARRRVRFGCRREFRRHVSAGDADASRSLAEQPEHASALLDAIGGLASHAEQAADEAAKYSRRIQKAVEFTEKADDGLQPKLWAEADIVIIGPSRTGKTTLSRFLARLGFKVANYPLVQGEQPPRELLAVDQRKVVTLMCQPEFLQNIRQERMKKLGRSASKYASFEKVREELNWVKCFYQQHFRSLQVVDTTGSDIAETAARILSQLRLTPAAASPLSAIAYSSS
eukprot:TRINITY_DN10690_c0_g1_i2.p1 TRINITY_DN10690_c0_g1~~TRINITY_DN10690_c0_g1_i2.p1  ORF type:complete len:298 (-),score=37.93 TRINITY_DN10690_c0_g1_i2:127-1020(-)